jgi:hypothetical protein
MQSSLTNSRQPVALGESVGGSNPARDADERATGDGLGNLLSEDVLQARLDALRRG